MLAAKADNLQGLPDRALLSLAFDTGPRRSEIVAVRELPADQGPAGAGRLFVAHSKSDEEGAGTYTVLSSSHDDRAYNAAGSHRRCGTARSSAASTAPATRRAPLCGPRGAGMTDQSATLVFRAVLDAAHGAALLGDIAEADYEHWRCSLTAHSTRVGLTRDVFASGEDFASIMQALRGKARNNPPAMLKP